MLRSDLIKKVMIDHPEFSRATAEQAIDAFYEAIICHLAKGGRVELRGFGVFTARERKARLGRNPASGELVEVEGKRLPHFSPSKGMSLLLTSDRSTSRP